MRVPSRIRELFQAGDKRGIAVVYVALFLVALIGITALAIDISYMYVAKTQLQNAADSAALAGASRLNVTASYSFDSYTSAINEATRFAGLNQAAKETVIIGSSLTSSVASNVYVDGTPGNDITFGNWDGNRKPAYIKAGEPGGTPVNAIQVRARRTADSARGSVGIFFGKIFGFDALPASAIATATPVGFAAIGLTICTNTCAISTPVDLLVQKADTPETGIGWTSFTWTQAPDIGKNGDVVNIIWQRPTANPVPINVCTPPLCITTNNGVGVALGELNDAFNDLTYDKVHKVIVGNKVKTWTVAVPVVDDDPSCLHTPGTACPPGEQGNKSERYHVLKWAIMDISSVNTTGNNKGVTASRIQCAGCINPPFRIPNQPAKLVKE